MASGRAVRSARALTATLIVGAAAFVTGLVLFDKVLAPRLVRGGNDVRVPDLANLNAAQSRAALARAGLRLQVRDERYDPAVPKGFVVSQEPEPDRWVRSGRSVSVVLSLGEEFASVPELFGESVRSARLLLSRAGLRPGRITKAVTTEAGPGLVVSTDPPAGRTVPKGAVVEFLVAAPSSPEDYVMPDLTGREANGAARDLEAFGFDVDVVGPGSGSRIESQDPPPGARVMRGQKIVLRVAGRLIQIQ